MEYVTVPAVEWSEIEGRYADFAFDAPMYSFVRQLHETEFTPYLHAFTSHDVLCISQQSPIPLRLEMLAIHFSPNQNVAFFEYWEQPYVKKGWRKECGPEEIFSTFIHFLKLKKWFTTFPQAFIEEERIAKVSKGNS